MNETVQAPCYKVLYPSTSVTFPGDISFFIPLQFCITKFNIAIKALYEKT